MNAYSFWFTNGSDRNNLEYNTWMFCLKAQRREGGWGSQCHSRTNLTLLGCFNFQFPNGKNPKVAAIPAFLFCAIVLTVVFINIVLLPFQRRINIPTSHYLQLSPDGSFVCTL